MPSQSSSSLLERQFCSMWVAFSPYLRLFLHEPRPSYADWPRTSMREYATLFHNCVTISRLSSLVSVSGGTDCCPAGRRGKWQDLQQSQVTNIHNTFGVVTYNTPRHSLSSLSGGYTVSSLAEFHSRFTLSTWNSIYCLKLTPHEHQSSSASLLRSRSLLQVYQLLAY